MVVGSQREGSSYLGGSIHRMWLRRNQSFRRAFASTLLQQTTGMLGCSLQPCDPKVDPSALSPVHLSRPLDQHTGLSLCLESWGADCFLGNRSYREKRRNWNIWRQGREGSAGLEAHRSQWHGSLGGMISGSKGVVTVVFL